VWGRATWLSLFSRRTPDRVDPAGGPGPSRAQAAGSVEIHRAWCRRSA
jgi:hypothetical protein